MMKNKNIFCPVFFNILKKLSEVQKQTIHQQKAHDLSYLELEEQGRGFNVRAWPCHRRQRLKNPSRAPMLFAARGRGAFLILPRPCPSGS